MGFKTVLLVVGVDHPDGDVDRAAAIAEGLAGHLTVLVLGIAPPPPTSAYGVVSNDIWAAQYQDNQGFVDERAAMLRDRLAASPAPVTVSSQFIDRASVSTLVARHARYADVTLILPEPEAAEPIQSWVTTGALFESGRPVILLPKGPSTFPAVRRAVIAWDASVEAAKAVRDAIGLMQRAERVTAVLIDPVPSFEGHGPEPGSDLAVYLGRHGIEVEVLRLPREGRDVAEVLQRACVDLESDLLVMGGFGHSRLRQRIFGGTTMSTLKSPGVATLMSH
jgi:nucleotide-binding universal stress UspA family protein